jgi:hypothetical protein
MTSLAREWNESYLGLHFPKEELFWSTYMGIRDEAAAPAEAEKRLKAWVSDPAHLPRVRDAISRATAGDDRIALEGWKRFFESNAIEDADARAMQSELVELERAIYEKRASLRFDYRTGDGESRQGSVNVLSVNVTTSKDETTRRSSFESLQGLERWVVGNGFLELVRRRNAFARKLGFRNFFAYKLMRNEGLTEQALDSIFGPFERATREKCFSEIARMEREHGPGVREPWELMFRATGDVVAELDPYFPFSKSVEVWGLSFWRLGIRFRGASLTLDLLDRAGKYENGFMHGPVPCWVDGGKWIPARINFTSNATPTQIGSGHRATVTLFHEGGHAAHFSNVTQPSPVFSQEFPPTSMAYAETQSMFCDSLLGDADWMKRYARNRAGEVIPDELVRRRMTTSQPFMAYRERAILVVALFEQRLYAMEDDALSPESVLALARRCEKDVFGLDAISRPLLTVPHLLSDSGACSYQGYLLAHMAVYQTRAHFKSKYGALADEERIGPDLASVYWSPGNSITHSESIRRLTGQSLGGQALAEECNASTDGIWERAKRDIATLDRRPAKGSLESVDLDASIRIVDGAEVIAETGGGSFAALARKFEAWIEARSAR